jgi:hypothetical protein
MYKNTKRNNLRRRRKSKGKNGRLRKTRSCKEKKNVEHRSRNN